MANKEIIKVKVFCIKCIYFDGGDLCYSKEEENDEGETFKPERCADKNGKSNCPDYRPVRG